MQVAYECTSVEKVQNNCVKIHSIKRDENLADVLTKQQMDSLFMCHQKEILGWLCQISRIRTFPKMLEYYNTVFYRTYIFLSFPYSHIRSHQKIFIAEYYPYLGSLCGPIYSKCRPCQQLFSNSEITVLNLCFSFRTHN